MGAGARVEQRPRGLLDPYVPRALLRHLVEEPEARVQVVDGTLLFADISGFTRLSERLARRGREGAEELIETIERCFTWLLRVAYDNGGGLLKFGGDALLLKFEGEDHAMRAARSAIGLRRRLRDAGPLQTSAGKVTLRMSQGLHSGEILLFLVGTSHREHLIAGPVVSTVVQMEKAADTGEIVISADAAGRLPHGCAGKAKGPGVLLASSPEGGPPPGEPRWYPDDDAIANCLSTALRAHLRSGRQPAEHRNASMAFLRATGVDDLLASEGIDALAQALHELVTDVQEAADAQQICFLASDIGTNEVRILLTAGAPRGVGEDEDRMLLAMRQVIERTRKLPVHIGVNRGNVFCGDVGPAYRRTYAVMGDATNLAARLMARAPAGELYATARVLDRAVTRFGLRELEPFTVKGKARPVQAWSVGPAIGSRARERVAEHFPLVGRERELAALDAVLASARCGNGGVVEIVGEEGIGKSRLVDEVRRRASAMRRLHAACEPYTAASPYAMWRELLRPLLGIAHDDDTAVVVARLTAVVRKSDPTLLPWLPLLAVPLDVDLPPTPAVAAIAPEFRTERTRDVMVRLLARLLAEPTLIEIEDGHHMDHASADLLAAIAHAVADRPWMVIVTRRDVESGFIAPDLPAVTRLEPVALGRDALLALAEAVTDASPLPPHVLLLAVDRSGGSPQFLRDLLRAAAAGDGSSLPESIEAAAAARMDLLAPADRALIRRAAVLGRTFDPNVLAEVIDEHVSPPDERTWARLWRYFDVGRDGSVQFKSAVVREAAYGALTYRTRRRLHAEVGDRLEREAGPAANEIAAVLSLHFERAGDDGRTWRYARAAGDRARDRFAHADAAILYRRALDASRGVGAPAGDVAQVWESLGRARARIGELTAAHEAFRAARRMVNGDAVREAQLLHLHARVDLDAGRVAPAARWALRSLQAADVDDAQAALGARARATSTLATIRLRQGRMTDAIELCHRAIDEAERAGEEAALANACYVLDWALVESGRAGEAVHSTRALQIYERLGELNRQAAVLNNMGGFAYRDGRWSDAVDLYRRGTEASLRAGNAADAAFGDCNIGELLADRGQLEEARTLLARALRTWRGSGYEWGVAYATAILGRAAARDGRHDEAAELLADAGARFRALRVRGDVDWVEALLAEAEAFARQADAALTRADLALAGLGDPGRLGALLHRVRGFAFAQLDDLAAAEDALEASLAEARAQAEEYEIAVTLDALKALSGLTGRPEPAERTDERDTILARLAVERLPAPPLSAARAGRRDPSTRLAPSPR